MIRSEVNGAPATLEELGLLALVNYSHFTSMQVRDRAVRGLDLHFDRLHLASLELFGHALDGERVRGYIRHALGDDVVGASVRVTVFSRDMAAVGSGRPAMPEVLVTVREAMPEPTGALRVRSVEFERLLPHLKHSATLGLFHHSRRARMDGFDGALFTDRAGRISEGSVWNVGFYEAGHDIAGPGVVWPSAPAPPGITMLLLRAGLERKGIRSEERDIHLADLPSFRSAFFTNSIGPVLPLASIDDTAFRIDADLIALLVDCYETNPWQPI